MSYTHSNSWEGGERKGVRGREEGGEGEREMIEGRTTGRSQRVGLCRCGWGGLYLAEQDPGGGNTAS